MNFICGKCGTKESHGPENRSAGAAVSGSLILSAPL